MLGVDGVWRAGSGGAGEGWPWRGAGSPGRLQRRRSQESGVRERGTGPAFMLLCECLRAWKEPLRMAALCSMQLLHHIVLLVIGCVFFFQQLCLFASFS